MLGVFPKKITLNFMERESILRNSTENHVECRDRFAEFMEMRHRNAMTALKIEKILSHEEPSDEYLTTRTQENIKERKEVHKSLTPILESLSATGLTKKAEHVKRACY